MERSTIGVAAAAVLTALVGTFALTRAVSSVKSTAPVVTADPGAAEASSRVEIDISGLEFSPPDLTIAPGTEVVWTNRESAQHTATAVDGTFSSPVLEEGDTYSFVFDAPGSFEYLCTFHVEMTGTITVEA
jgi:plastocyanin